MTKSVCKNPRVILGGNDVSEWVKSWNIHARIGELFVCELELVKADYLVIQKNEDRTRANGMRVCVDDTILVHAVDISSYIEGYVYRVHVGYLDTVVLRIQCSRDVLRINGGYPWEEEPGQVDGPAVLEYVNKSGYAMKRTPSE